MKVGLHDSAMLDSVQSQFILTEALTDYQLSLDEFTADKQSFLALFFARDRVAAMLQQSQIPTPDQAQQLLMLDARLRQQIIGEPAESLSSWRASLQPPESHWWWYLDKDLHEQEQEKDLLWEILAVTFFILTVPLIVDVIQRLWANTPDNTAIVGSLLLLLVTASPFTKRGQELTQWLLRRVSWLPSHRRAEAMAMTALFAFVLVAAGRFIIMPQYARVYNNRGVAARQRGDLTAARQQFQRAAALNKDFSAGYFNLADVYEEAAQPDVAMALYREAIAHDLGLGPAYSNLGRLYLQQGDPGQAIALLQAGLSRLEEGAGDAETVVRDQPPADSEQVESEMATRYRLLTHLGQAYYEIGEMTTSVSTLEQATVLEDDLQLDPAFYDARPHYYLALAYEALEHPPAAIIAEWEVALSYLGNDNDPIGWETTIREHLASNRK